MDGTLRGLELNRGMDHALPPEEDADVPGFRRALGVPGLADIHVHFLPPRLLRRVAMFGLPETVGGG